MTFENKYVRVSEELLLMLIVGVDPDIIIDLYVDGEKVWSGTWQNLPSTYRLCFVRRAGPNETGYEIHATAQRAEFEGGVSYV